MKASFILCLFVSLLVVSSCAASNDDAISAFRGPQQQHENAYVAVYSDGSADADARYLALRVMIRSLQVTRPKADIVIMVSVNTREDIREMFRSYGCIVLPVLDKPEYYPEDQQMQVTAARESFYGRKCPLNQDYLYVYTLTQYKRVIYLEAETMVFHNMDDLFKCGHFCMVYANENIWNSGFMVIKPDLNMFRQWQKHFLDKALRIQERTTFFSSAPACYDEYHDSILTMYPTIEAAPLFSVKKPQQEDPVMRTSALYCVNGIFFYEHFSWILYSLNLPLDEHGGSYDPKMYRTVDADTLPLALSNQSTAFQWGIPNDVPAFSMSFYNPKPFYWWEAAFFDLNWYWQDIRALLLDDYYASYWSTALSRLALLLGVYFLFEKMAKVFFTKQFRERMIAMWLQAARRGVIPASLYSSSTPIVTLSDASSSSSHVIINAVDSVSFEKAALKEVNAVHPAQLLFSQCKLPVSPRFRVTLMATFFGIVFITAFSLLVCKPLIPATTPPSLAWPMFCLFQNLGIYMFLKVLINVFPLPEHIAPFEDINITYMATGFLLELVTLAHNKADLHKHFVEKIVVFEAFLAIIWILQTKGFRKLFMAHFEAQNGTIPMQMKTAAEEPQFLGTSTTSAHYSHSHSRQ